MTGYPWAEAVPYVSPTLDTRFADISGELA